MNKTLTSVKHQAFLDAVLDGHGFTKAGELAGIKNITRDVIPVVLTPVVRAYARGRLRGKVDIEAAPAAYKILFDMMNDPTTTKGLRADIGKFFIAHSLPAPKAKEEDDGADKPANEMTNNELLANIDRIEAEMAKRATPAEVVVIDQWELQSVDDLM